MAEAHGGVGIWARTGTPAIVIELDTPVGIPELWDATTTAEGLRGWLGILDGNREHGDLRFALLANGAQVAAGSVQVLGCRPPYIFQVAFDTGQGPRTLGLEFSGRPGRKRIAFARELGPGDDPGTAGPDWEYFLQRLLVHLEGGDVDSVRWEDYFPALASAYAKAPE